MDYFGKLLRSYINIHKLKSAFQTFKIKKKLRSYVIFFMHAQIFQCFVAYLFYFIEFLSKRISVLLNKIFMICQFEYKYYSIL